jgi:lipoprotein-anchoring transpeptidase ErfK/SrfK
MKRTILAKNSSNSNNLPQNLWGRSAIFLASALLGISAWTSGANPSLAESEYHNTIARNILNLQQSQKRWIEIDLTTQRLIAWEGANPVYAVIISTGKDGTPTPTGTFAIQSKYETARMQGEGYDVPDVPFTMYYYRGYAIHGAYWHNNFGTPVSHGCTNVAVNHAEWLFNWADIGTSVVVHY